jgi:hypothetical protein
MPKVEKIWGLNLPGNPRATLACRGTPLTFFLPIAVPRAVPCISPLTLYLITILILRNFKIHRTYSKGFKTQTKLQLTGKLIMKCEFSRKYFTKLPENLASNTSSSFKITDFAKTTELHRNRELKCEVTVAKQPLLCSLYSFRNR